MFGGNLWEYVLKLYIISFHYSTDIAHSWWNITFGTNMDHFELRNRCFSDIKISLKQRSRIAFIVKVFLFQFSDDFLPISKRRYHLIVVVLCIWCLSHDHHHPSLVSSVASLLCIRLTIKIIYISNFCCKLLLAITK